MRRAGRVQPRSVACRADRCRSYRFTPSAGLLRADGHSPEDLSAVVQDAQASAERPYGPLALVDGDGAGVYQALGLQLEAGQHTLLHALNLEAQPLMGLG